MMKFHYNNHLSWGHDREKGGECHGNKYVPYYDGVLVFWWGTLHYSIMMMSLHYTANDAIGLSQDYK